MEINGLAEKASPFSLCNCRLCGKYAARAIKYTSTNISK